VEISLSEHQATIMIDSGKGDVLDRFLEIRIQGERGDQLNPGLASLSPENVAAKTSP
jgi:hypothetical protein